MSKKQSYDVRQSQFDFGLFSVRLGSKCDQFRAVRWPDCERDPSTVPEAGEPVEWNRLKDCTAVNGIPYESYSGVWYLRVRRGDGALHIAALSEVSHPKPEPRHDCEGQVFVIEGVEYELRKKC
jgi:hypothetical protein